LRLLPLPGANGAGSRCRSLLWVHLTRPFAACIAMVRYGFACGKEITAPKITLNTNCVRTRNTAGEAFTFEVDTDFRCIPCNRRPRTRSNSRTDASAARARRLLDARLARTATTRSAARASQRSGWVKTIIVIVGVPAVGIVLGAVLYAYAPEFLRTGRICPHGIEAAQDRPLPFVQRDVFHGHLISNPGVPAWWPMFYLWHCGGSVSGVAPPPCKNGGECAPTAHSIPALD